MLKKIVLTVCVLFTVVACNRLKGPKKPDNLISKDKMVNILMDARIMASATASNRRIMQNHGVDMGNYVFDKHNIDSLQFVESNEYYAFYVNEYEEIYTKVEDSFKKLQTKYKKLEEEEEEQRLRKIKEDSIKAIIAKKDSLNRLNIKDSLKILKETDSLIDVSSDKLIDEGILINPISETDLQSH